MWVVCGAKVMTCTPASVKRAIISLPLSFKQLPMNNTTIPQQIRPTCGVQQD
jgi:hypothetical protein